MSRDELLRRRVLILWNQVGEDIYERWQREGPPPLSFDPARTAMEVSTVQEEMDELVTAVRHGGYEVACINIEDDVDRLLAALRLFWPDVVFNLIEFFHDDESMEVGITGLYDLYGLAYTGSRPHALALCQRKDLTKLLLVAAGLPTAPYFVVPQVETPIPDPVGIGLSYPLIVKPAAEDASGGIDAGAVVWDYEGLCERVRLVVGEFEQAALVEEYIEGREIHVAILGNDPPEVLPFVEMTFVESQREGDSARRPRIVSYEAKWDPSSEAFYGLETVCPATGLDPELERRIAEVALSAYQVTECRDYARIDLRVSAAGEPYILEVNPNPDLSDGSAFILCARAGGRTYAQALSELIELAAERMVVDDSGGEEEAMPSDLLARKFWRRARAGAKARDED